MSYKDNLQDEVLCYYEKAHIVLTDAEKASLEMTDFGLNDFRVMGLNLITYVNNEFYCAKEMVLLPGQTCGQHRHPPRPGRPGKTETFRCRWGLVYLYVPGEGDGPIQASLPASYAPYLTVRREIVLRPGEQYTILSDTPHWFQGGPQGAVVSEFSSNSDDASDIFDDPRIVRSPGTAG